MPSKKKEERKDFECMGNCGKCKRCKCNHCGGAVYGLGFVGSAIYYISTATGFWMGVLGVIKSLVWPAFLVFELLKYLNM